MYTDLNFLKIKTISWIPDFQHNYLPELFSEEDVKQRTEVYQETAHSNVPLILSSNACLNDYKKFYDPIPSKPIAVVPFVSYIKPELEQLHADAESRILEKFGLTDKRYVCISNQFWKHKNHLLVFKALNILMKNCEDFSTRFIFTGKMEDIRNPQYIGELKEYSEKLNKICKIVGFVDRTEQLVLMKNAEFIIQPSLFEGWGTVVEDAKVLDKTILLSNIPVHVEQKNDKCILFDAHDEYKLAELIAEQLNVRHVSSVQEGISDMERRAIEYSKGFEKILFYEDAKS